MSIKVTYQKPAEEKLTSVGRTIIDFSLQTITFQIDSKHHTFDMTEKQFDHFCGTGGCSGVCGCHGMADFLDKIPEVKNYTLPTFDSKLKVETEI